MRRWTVFLAAGMMACSGRTPAGPIGQPIDLRQYLPDALKTIEPTASDSAFHHRMLVGPDSASVEVTWKTASRAGGHYLTGIEAKLLAPVAYDSLTIGGVSDLTNAGSKSEPTESAKIRIGWFKGGKARRLSGATVFGFDAAGRRSATPAQPH